MTGASSAGARHAVPLLAEAKTIAVVGLSSDHRKPSHAVAAYLQEAGYTVIPVNPREERVLGETSYPDLAAIPNEIKIDIVNVFRPAEVCPGIAHQAAARKAKVLWLQQGIVSEEAAKIASAAGMTVVMDRCIKTELTRHIGT